MTNTHHTTPATSTSDNAPATFRATWRLEVPWHAHTDDRRLTTRRPYELAGGATEQEGADAA